MLCQAQCTGLVGGRQDRQKLFSAIAGDHVGLAQPLANAQRHFAQHGVSGQVAIGVVDALEVVDVQHQESQRFPLAPSARAQRWQQVLQGTAVVQTGEAVVRGQGVLLLQGKFHLHQHKAHAVDQQNGHHRKIGQPLHLARHVVDRIPIGRPNHVSGAHDQREHQARTAGNQDPAARQAPLDQRGAPGLVQQHAGHHALDAGDQDVAPMVVPHEPQHHHHVDGERQPHQRRAHRLRAVPLKRRDRQRVQHQRQAAEQVGCQDRHFGPAECPQAERRVGQRIDHQPQPPQRQSPMQAGTQGHKHNRQRLGGRSGHGGGPPDPSPETLAFVQWLQDEISA